MLTEIRVKNFKSLKDVTLKLRQRNLLVGANMAGKSNLIDLFRFICQMAFPAPGSMGLANAFVTRGGLSEVLWKGGNETVIKIALSGKTSEHGPEWPWDYEIVIQGDARYNNFRIASEHLTIRRQSGVAVDDLIENVGFERHLCNIQHQRLLSVSDSLRSVLEFENPNWPGSFLRSAIFSWKFYELVPPVMRNPNPMGAALFLTEHGENLSQWLLYLQTRYGDAFARIQRVVKDALPQVMSLFTSPTQQSTVLLGAHEKHLTRPVTLSQMSAGELAFIAYLSLIFAPAELTGGLYCVEDIENYLHPSLTETLLEILRQAQEEWERKGQAAQILMTTHSPIVVDKMKLEEIVFTERKNGETVCSRPSDAPQLQKMLQDEEIGLGDLVYTGVLSNVSK